MNYLGVDGGGTKTAFMLIDEKGRIKGWARKGTTHYLQVGVDEVKSTLREGFREVSSEAGIEVEDIDYAFLGLPCYGEEVESVSILEDVTSSAIGEVNFKVGNDVEVGWAGSLACRPGINLVAGTGAIGFGSDADGDTARVSGWDYFIGDEGSAFWLGKELLSVFTKQSDGREKKTALYEIVREHFDLSRDLDLIKIIHEDINMERGKIAELSLLLYKAAGKGDSRAAELFKEAAYEHSLMVKALLERLNFEQESSVPVSYSGGVFKAGDYVLKPLKEFIADQRVKIIEPVLMPVTGAALYALYQHRGAEAVNDQLIDRLAEEEKKCDI